MKFQEPEGEVGGVGVGGRGGGVKRNLRPNCSAYWSSCPLVSTMDGDIIVIRLAKRRVVSEEVLAGNREPWVGRGEGRRGTIPNAALSAPECFYIWTAVRVI